MENQLTLAATDVASAAFALPSGSRLLAPLRAAVEKAQSAARPLVAPIADGDAYMPLLDYIAEQIETLEHIGDATHQAHRALMDAVHCIEGYDTWPKADLAVHIRRITALRDALNTLRDAVVDLYDAERSAFSDFANTNLEPRGNQRGRAK